MRIDLKWAIPFVMPFLLVALFRALFWFAGIEWDVTVKAVSFMGILGVIGGGIIVVIMIEEKKHLWVAIGRGDRP